MSEQFANHSGTTLAAAITSTTRPVTFSVASAAGLPAAGNFRLIIDSEILLITTISGTSLTGSNVEGTAAATHASGAAATHVLTAGAIAQVELDVVGSWNTAYTPTLSQTGSMTLSSITYYDFQYIQVGPTLTFNAIIGFTVGGTPNGTINLTMPAAPVAQNSVLTANLINPSGALLGLFAVAEPALPGVQILCLSGATFPAGAQTLYIGGSYRTS